MSQNQSSDTPFCDRCNVELGAQSQGIVSSQARQQCSLEGVRAMRPPREHREGGRQVCSKELLVVAIVSYTITDILMSAVRSESSYTSITQPSLHRGCT